MKPEALLFDMDGVLIDVSASYRLAIQYTVEHFLGIKIEPEEIQKYKNRGGFNDDWELSRQMIIAGGEKIALERIIKQFQKYYQGDNFSGLIQNEKWLLNEKKLARLKNNYHTGIVTGRIRVEAEYALNNFATRAYFDELITVDDLPPGQGKPNPLGIKKIMTRLGVNTACYFGDTIDDMQAAAAAGIMPIGILNSAFPAMEQERLLKQHGARQVLPHIDELESILPFLSGDLK
jgi:HAD superfamily hydrolase (TIGR01548 family)